MQFSADSHPGTEAISIPVSLHLDRGYPRNQWDLFLLGIACIYLENLNWRSTGCYSSNDNTEKCTVAVHARTVWLARGRDDGLALLS